MTLAKLKKIRNDLEEWVETTDLGLEDSEFDAFAEIIEDIDLIIELGEQIEEEEEEEEDE